ncbi:hypothetical protein IWW36_003600 [Coemansia brasiliensis]|uniref:Uncharacterized protein n=1 Tax=Coemansia brasiliensis TaxID=2650707 RepID=A0A9W8LZM2_9FUNG|nr:hypothetical protein IWW36_003600 [Coemansia brasiliensis]
MHAKSPGPVYPPGHYGYSPPHKDPDHSLGKYKSRTALHRFCSDILTPDFLRSKEPPATNIKNVIESKLAMPFKRRTTSKWALAKYHQNSGHINDIPKSLEGAVYEDCDSNERTSRDYASSKHSGSRSTLVDSLMSAGSESSGVSAHSLGQYTVAAPSREQSWTRSNIANATHADSSRLETRIPELQRQEQNAHYCPNPYIPYPMPQQGMWDTTHQQFILQRHAQFPDVLEVIGCRSAAVEYRRIVHKGKLWCASFYKAGQTIAQTEPRNRLAAATCGYFGPGMQRCDVPSFQMPDSHGSYMSTQVLSSSFSGNAPVLSFVPSSFVSGTNPQQQQQKYTWPPRYPRSFEKNRLWEISSPQPGVFPLHCRDTRGSLDPIPLTPMVLDRYQFCYRFYLSGTKMRWQACKQSRSVVELQCFVRNRLAARLLLGGCSSTGVVGINGRQRLWRNKGTRSSNYSPATYTECDAPSIIILPTAFSRLPNVDAAIVESFVLFTGIEVFECFLHAA